MQYRKCDACGKMMPMNTAFDADGHTTKDGYVHIVYEDSRDYYGEYDLCINCLKKIEEYAKTLKED